MEWNKLLQIQNVNKILHGYSGNDKNLKKKKKNNKKAQYSWKK